MKTSNKLLFGLLGFIVMALIATNLILKKTLMTDSNKTTVSTDKLQQSTPLPTDTIVVDSSSVAPE